MRVVRCSHAESDQNRTDQAHHQLGEFQNHLMLLEEAIRRLCPCLIPAADGLTGELLVAPQVGLFTTQIRHKIENASIKTSYLI